LPVVVIIVPGFSGNHLLSIFGESGKAVRSKLMADPGPQSSEESAVDVGDPAGEVVPDGVVVDPAGEVDSDVAGEVVGATCPVGAAQEASAEIARSSVHADPRADSRLFGWNIKAAFRSWNDVLQQPPPAGRCGTRRMGSDAEVGLSQGRQRRPRREHGKKSREIHPGNDR
jgi:hypothetical protein